MLIFARKLNHVWCCPLFTSASQGENCPNAEFNLVRISRMRTEYKDSIRKSPFSAQIRENTYLKKTPFSDIFHAVSSIEHLWKTDCHCNVLETPFSVKPYFVKLFLQYFGKWTTLHILFLMEIQECYFTALPFMFNRTGYCRKSEARPSDISKSHCVTWNVVPFCLLIELFDFSIQIVGREKSR